ATGYLDEAVTPAVVEPLDATCCCHEPYLRLVMRLIAPGLRVPEEEAPVLPNIKKAPGGRASLGPFHKSNQKPHFLQEETVRVRGEKVKKKKSDVEGLEEFRVRGVFRQLLEKLDHRIPRLHLEEDAANLVAPRA